MTDEAALEVELSCVWAHIWLARERLRTIETLTASAEARRASHEIAGARAAAREALKLVRDVADSLSQDVPA